MQTFRIFLLKKNDSIWFLGIYITYISMRFKLHFLFTIFDYKKPIEPQKSTFQSKNPFCWEIMIRQWFILLCFLKVHQIFWNIMNIKILIPFCLFNLLPVEINNYLCILSMNKLLNIKLKQIIFNATKTT